MKITEFPTRASEYITVKVIPMKTTNGKTRNTGKQASFQIRNHGAKDVYKIKEILQFIMTLRGVLSIFNILKLKRNKWATSYDIQNNRSQKEHYKHKQKRSIRR